MAGSSSKMERTIVDAENECQTGYIIHRKVILFFSKANGRSVKKALHSKVQIVEPIWSRKCNFLTMGFFLSSSSPLRLVVLSLSLSLSLCLSLSSFWTCGLILYPLLAVVSLLA
jgi:hypothetical protein